MNSESRSRAAVFPALLLSTHFYFDILFSSLKRSIPKCASKTSRIGKAIQTEGRLVIPRAGEIKGGKREWLLMVMGILVGMTKCSEIDCNDCTTQYTKNHRIVYFKWMNYMVNYISIKLFFFFFGEFWRRVPERSSVIFRFLSRLPK